MASSDDEEIVPRVVTNYYFVDEKNKPISFSILPICWDGTLKSNEAKWRVFLRGLADGGLCGIYKQVTSWRLGFQDDHPEILVLLKDSKWVKLSKPRSSYEDRFRTIMITVQWLHFLQRNPEASEKSLWDHLYKVFSSFEFRPSKDDLRDHVLLIKLFAERDKTLAKSQLLLGVLKEKLGRRSSFCVAVESNSVAKKPCTSYNDLLDEGKKYVDGEEFEEEPGLFDSVCAICDDGGEILSCVGRCLRSFHATKDAVTESYCTSLGYSRAQVEAIQNFVCKNCLYKQHQCFACGKLGSSDKTANAEVFLCVSATCGHFYHPRCVAPLLFPESEAEAIQFRKKIAAGESFTCPVHKCFVCKEGENRDISELQFAICRRCPKSYHRRCLPRNIRFEKGQSFMQRAWNNLLPSRILIYCLKHKIDENLETPIRNHILFPEIPQKKKIVFMVKRETKILAKNRQVYENLPTEFPSGKRFKLSKEISFVDGSCYGGKGGQRDIKPVLLEMTKPLEESTLTDSLKISTKEKGKYAAPAVGRTSLGKIVSSSFPVIGCETEKKMKAFMDEVSSSLTLEDIRKRCTMPSTHSYSGRDIDKIITQGKVEGFVEAIQIAVQKLEDGVCVDDAKTICEPKILNQIISWKNKLNVYLSPFLHGMRYTSFGRHFTKVDKLKEIVDKLQWYIKSGDMLVDFCCGANDFSTLMKKKLDAVGKRCSFKNYDLFQPKIDFEFEQRDWMTVEPNELPDGSQLIMGLNPPFGVKAALANKFIDKALTFQPKLLVLIVPKETQRLDEKDPPYDLIWEDHEKLSGKSFYLPGSVDTDDKQMEQWNLKPPPLYLWSRCDWTKKHNQIAVRNGHVSESQTERAVYANEIGRDFDERQPMCARVALEDREADNLSDMSIFHAERSMYGSPFECSERAINHGGCFSGSRLGRTYDSSSVGIEQFPVFEGSRVGGCTGSPAIIEGQNRHNTIHTQHRRSINYELSSSADESSRYASSLDEVGVVRNAAFASSVPLPPGEDSYMGFVSGSRGFAPVSLPPPYPYQGSSGCGLDD